MKAIKFFAAAALVSALALSCSSQPDVKVDAELPTAAEVDSVSYLIGINFGSFLKGNNFAEDLKDINMAEVKKGMEDFLAAEGNPYDPEFGKQFKIDLDKMGQILNGFILQGSPQPCKGRGIPCKERSQGECRHYSKRSPVYYHRFWC